MPISRDTVEHVARLAHIGLTSGEVDDLAVQLSSVVDHIGKLQRVDTEGVPPTAHVVPVESVMREDELRPSWLPSQVLANAPHSVDDLFEVQAVLDE